MPAQRYGWLFGLNICGMMAMNAANSRLVTTVGSDRMLRWGLAVMAVAGMALAIDGQTWFGARPVYGGHNGPRSGLTPTGHRKTQAENS